jgi:hypothetical protein
VYDLVIVDFIEIKLCLHNKPNCQI